MTTSRTVEHKKGIGHTKMKMKMEEARNKNGMGWDEIQQAAMTLDSIKHSPDH
jgi:hypothetical protein